MSCTQVYDVCVCLCKTKSDHYLSLFHVRTILNFSWWVVQKCMMFVCVCVGLEMTTSFPRSLSDPLSTLVGELYRSAWCLCVYVHVRLWRTRTNHFLSSIPVQYISNYSRWVVQKCMILCVDVYVELELTTAFPPSLSNSLSTLVGELHRYLCVYV